MQFVLNILHFGLRCAVLPVLMAALLPSAGSPPLEAAVTKLLVLDMRAGENVELPAARALFRRFRAKLRSTGLVNITLARATSVAADAAACADVKCAARSAGKLKLGKVLLGRVRKPGRDYVAEMLVIAASGAVVEIRVSERLPSLETEDREQGAERLARKMEAEMRKRGYRPRRRLTPTERWLTLVPGVGQYYTGEYGKSGFFISAGFLTFRNYWMARRDHQRAREEFHDSGVPALIALSLRNEPQLSVAVNTLYAARVRDNLDARARTGNIGLVLLGGLLVWNFLDAENDYEYFSTGRLGLRTARLEWHPGANGAFPARVSSAGPYSGRGESGRLLFVLRAAF